MSRLEYEVVITGNEAPFKWEVKEGGTVPAMGINTDDGKWFYPRGEADTPEQAFRDAYAAALECERHRRYKQTIDRRVLFTVEEDGEVVPGDLPEVPDAPPEWMT